MENSLTKPVEYLSQFPINIGVYSIEYCPIHLHHDIEVVYVLKGAVEVRFNTFDIQLNEGDLYIINSDDLHVIEGLTEGHRMILMRVDITHYMHLHNLLNHMTFAADFADQSAIDHVKNNLLKLYKLSKSETKQQDSIGELIEDTMITFVNEFRGKNTEDEIALKIINYVYNNYNSDISLESIADIEQIDKQDLEETIKYYFGGSFQELLDTIRIEESEKKLLATENSIEDIASNCGFSSLDEFANLFQAVYKSTPDDYRKEMLPLTISQSEIDGQIFTDYFPAD